MCVPNGQIVDDINGGVDIKSESEEIEVADKELSIIVWKSKSWWGCVLSVYQWWSDQITKQIYHGNHQLVYTLDNTWSQDYANYTRTTPDV